MEDILFPCSRSAGTGFFVHPFTKRAAHAPVNAERKRGLETLYLWCKEGWQRSALGDFQAQKQALSRFFLGAMIISDTVLEVVRRELRRVSPDVRFDIEQIRTVLEKEVLKREVMEGEKANEARKKILRSAKTSLRATKGDKP